MRSALISLIVGTSAIGLTGGAQAQTSDGPAASPSLPSTIEDIVVTARRESENLQDVPVAVSVVSQAIADRKGTFTANDLQSIVPGLTVTPSVADRNNVVYSIRGQGYAYGTTFPAVITYFNEVPVSQISPGQFFDMENVQVLRGPQGVLFGRVTDGGNVMIATRKPTDQFDGYVEAKLGNLNLRTFTGALNIPIVPDAVALRLAAQVARRDGFTENLATGADLDNIRYETYRASLVIKPAEGIENYTVVNYQHGNENGTSNVFAALKDDPANGAAPLRAAVSGLFPLFPGAFGLDGNGTLQLMRPGLTPLTADSYLNSLKAQLAAQQARGPRKVFLTDTQKDKRRQLFIVNQTSFDLSDDIQLKNIFGYTKFWKDDANSFIGVNGYVVSPCHAFCDNDLLGVDDVPFGRQEQYSNEVRLAGKSFGGQLDWSLGGYYDKQKPFADAVNNVQQVGILFLRNVQNTVTTSKAIFGHAEYDFGDAVPRLKVNAGVRQTWDTYKTESASYTRPIGGAVAQAALATVIGPGLAAAAFGAIPPGATCEDSLPGSIFAAGLSNCTRINTKFKATTWTFGTTYELRRNSIAYAKISKGYRPGGSNVSAPAGFDPRYAPETDTSIEIGLKATWEIGNVGVRTNIAAYRDRYKSIQKQVVITGTQSNIVNAAAATIKGIEFEGQMVVGAFTFGANAAYTDAQYDKIVNAAATDPCNPNLSVAIGYCSDSRFAFTPKLQYTLNARYKLPTSDLGDISIGASYYHQSSVATNDNSEVSNYLGYSAVERPYGTVDMDLSWQNVGGRPVDISLFVNNLTDKLYRAGTDSLIQNASLGIASDIYAPPRTFGASLRYRFGSSAN